VDDIRIITVLVLNDFCSASNSEEETSDAEEYEADDPGKLQIGQLAISTTNNILNNSQESLLLE
jgi:mRNA deadenylase 3'-5' endonuclease subunit Ccr4